MIKIISKYKLEILILLLSFLTTWPLFRSGYFSHHDDLQVIRIFEMRRCFTDLQIPCRWGPDMGFGYGYPIFNYYNPLIYYLGAVLSFVLGYVWSVKTLFWMGLVLGPVSVYLLGKELFDKNSGFLAAVLFMFVPYRALNTYVRGALSELIALSLIPLVFYLSYVLIRDGKKRNFLFFVITLAFFLITHNVSMVIWLVPLFAWGAYCFLKFGFAHLLKIFLGGVFAFGLSSFFVIPAFLEKNLVNTESLIQAGLDFHGHFTSVRQLLIDRSWGYGASVLGPNDMLSLQIGWPYWWIVALLFLFIVYRLIKHKDNKYSALSFYLVGVFIFSIYMTHGKSSFIWEAVPLLPFVQFPWRFLGIAALCSSLAAGLIYSQLGEKYKKIFLITVFVLTVLLNWSYFRPQFFYPEQSDSVKTQGEDWRLQQRGAILDYLPITAKVPEQEAPPRPVFPSGTGEIVNFQLWSNRWQIDLFARDYVTVRVPVFYFPGWQVKVDGVDKQIFLSEDGEIEFGVEPGRHIVIGQFIETETRLIADLVSLISLIALLIFLINKSYSKRIFEK